MSARATPDRRSDYRHFCEITTRWMDNDVYQHVNNVVYYSFFDTAVGQYLIGSGFLELHSSAVIGLVAETRCQYFSSLSFPATVSAGLRVGRMGTSSVRYEIGIFRDAGEVAAAQGHFVHVYVDRATSRPIPLPEKLRQALAPLVVDAVSRQEA